MFVVYDITGYADRTEHAPICANEGRQRHKEEEVERQIGLLKEIMKIDQKHTKT